MTMSLETLSKTNWSGINNVNKSTGNRGSPTMPLAQEKPRFEITFTNNNDHNYLHKKFKKMASTVRQGDEQSSESDSSLHRETPKPQTSSYSSISNRSIAAAHPEIEKIKFREVTTAGTDRFVENNVQTNFRNGPHDCVTHIVNQNAGETSFDEDNVNKTENTETDVPKDLAAGGAAGRYVCPYCRLSCAKPSVLQKHIRAHTNERPYPCVTCGIAFKTKSNLYKHCRSRSHTVRSQGGENAPPITEEDWSPESESDTSLPPTSMSETGSEGIIHLVQDISRMSDMSSPEMSSDRASPATPSIPPNNDFSKMKAIYKPKFHRVSLYQEEDERNKKILSPNPNFLNEHISKIISDNEAIVDVLETPLQKKYGKIKQIAESKQLLMEDNLTNLEIKSEPGPLNLSKSSSDEIIRRKRCHSESFGPPEHYKHPLNPEGSIIKDLLLKTKNYTTGLLPATNGFYEADGLYPCPLCNVAYKSAENLEIHRIHYCKVNSTNGISVSTLSPREVIKSFRPENMYMRSNSINVTLQETQNNEIMTKSSPLKSPLSKPPSKPDNLIIKPESNDIIAPLPSPGPLLGNTRLVDSRISADYSYNKIENIKKPVPSPKRRLDSRTDTFSPRLSEDVQRMESYQQSKMRCFENNPTTLRSLEELSHAPMRQNTTSLQMFGGEVKIINNSGSTTTLRIEPTRQLSPITIPQNMSPNKYHMEGEASNIVQSGLHSGGTIVHNPPTPKENINSPHPQTPRIMLSIAASIPTPNLTVTALPTPNITHFQFPPLGAITAFNPLTLPPLSPAASPNGATTILHGGKLIPHVPGIPGPNTAAPYGSNSGLLLKYSQNSDFSQSDSSSPKEEIQPNRTLSQQRPKIIMSQNYDNQMTNSNMKITSPTVRTVIKDLNVQSSDISTRVLPVPVPRFKIRHAGEKTSMKKSQIKIDEKLKDAMTKNNNISESSKHNTLKSPKCVDKVTNIHSPQSANIKMTEQQEIRNFNFENFITKSEIYNNIGQQTSPNSPQEPLAISVQTSERSETSYFQKNANTKTSKEENKSRFLRPSTLPLKPGTFTPKKHHGITPNANTMPLISPETPRPAKAYGQLYLNGNAYTYLGLKCSTKVFYCTLNRPQPTYVPNQVSLSMYCNWQILLEQAPNPLGLSTISLMSLYDSRHRPQDISIATFKQDQILTHSSQWNKDFQENKQRSSMIDTKKVEDSKPTSAENTSTKSKELAGGFESNEEYTYVRGRGRGRYVCLECGIRCKKPSMLKKHIRTHTDVRPYTCKHCSFSFKTKGNLTKHMKSKAHYKKCCELGINPNEGSDIDTNDLNQGYGESDDDSDSDVDDGNEGETESSDTDSWKSRLPEHEAAHCLLSLSGSRPSSTAAPGLLTSARPTTYPYTPIGKEEAALLTSKFSNSNTDTPKNADAESTMEIDNEPMDLSRGEIKSATISEIHTARESSVLASLASNTAKLPLQVQWTNGEPMLHAYLTERALQDTKIKQSQFISSLSKNKNKQELSKIIQQEGSNVILNSYGTHDSTPKTPSAPSMDVFSVSVSHSKPSLTVTSVSRVVTSPCVTNIETSSITSTSTHIGSPATPLDIPKSTVPTESNTNTENAKFVASEYLKMARGKADISNTSEKNEQENKNTAFIQTEENDKRDRENSDVEHKNVHSEPFPLVTKVVIGAGGVAFKVNSKMDDLTPSAYTPGRLTADGRSVCVVCNKSFSKPSQLRLHINIHYMERPFRCSACAVSFRTRGHLQKHERSGSHHNKVSMTSTFGAATSSNPRPFRCTDCNIAFRIHGHLAKHLRSKMHVMRLECLSKLPFGTFAEIERAGVSLTDIDTTDCANSLASLQLLAQKLHEKDPTKLEAWDPTMVPPLLPAGRESSDDEDAGLVIDNKLSENSDKESSSEFRTNNREGQHTENSRIKYSATDT